MGIEIIMLDDELSADELLAPMLRRLGHKVQHFSDERRLLQSAENGLWYDLGLIDLSLPHIDGREIIKSLKELYPFRPLIATSGHPFQPTLANGLLTKPYGWSKLARAINTQLPGTIPDQTYRQTA